MTIVHAKDFVKEQLDNLHKELGEKAGKDVAFNSVSSSRLYVILDIHEHLNNPDVNAEQYLKDRIHNASKQVDYYASKGLFNVDLKISSLVLIELYS